MLMHEVQLLLGADQQGAGKAEGIDCGWAAGGPAAGHQHHVAAHKQQVVGVAGGVLHQAGIQQAPIDRVQLSSIHPVSLHAL